MLVRKVQASSWLSSKESSCNAADTTGTADLILGLGRSPGEGNGNPLQCSCLENPMDRGAWRATDHGLLKSQTQLKNNDKKSTMVCIVKAVVFPVVMHRYASWIVVIKKAEHQRIDAFELRCWRRFLRVPWTAGRSNQSILKEVNPEDSLEELVLKLKLQYFGAPILWPPEVKSRLIEKDPEPWKD